MTDKVDPPALVINKGVDDAFRAFARSTSLILGRAIVSLSKGKPGLDGPEAFYGVTHPEASFSAPSQPVVPPVKVDWPVANGLAGASVAVGGMGAGKSEFIYSKLGVTKVLRVGEPVERFDSDSRSVLASSFAEAVFRAVYLAKQGEKVAIDGTRQLVFADLGPATEGGVSSGLYMALTNISNFAAQHGVHIVLTLNPMVKSELVTQVFNNVSASATGGWLIEGGRPTEETHRTADGRAFGATNFESKAAPTLGSSMLNPGLSATSTPIAPTLGVFNTPDPEDDEVAQGRVGTRFVFDGKE